MIEHSSSFRRAVALVLLRPCAVNSIPLSFGVRWHSQLSVVILSVSPGFGEVQSEFVF